MFLSLRTSSDKFEHWYEPKLGRNREERRENGQTAKNSSGEVNAKPSAITPFITISICLHKILDVLKGFGV